MNAGIPDYLGCYEGYFMALELKALGKKLTKLQHWNLEQIIHAGGKATRCHSFEEVQAWAHRIEERYGPTKKQR
jgi:hypothetical protein